MSAIERRNALTFSLLDNFPDNLSTGGEVGIKIPYSQGTMCENQLDFSAILSIAAAAAVICLATWQPPERERQPLLHRSKNDPFKGRLATTLLIFSFVRESWPAHGNVVLLKLS